MRTPCCRVVAGVLFVLATVLGGWGDALALPFAYVANFGSDDVSAYRIDAGTGALTPVTASPFAAGLNPASVVTTETHVPPYRP
jgi:hypothetical protein